MNAVQGAIAANDAACIHLGRVRYCGERHEEAAELLLRLASHSEDAKENARRLRSILAHKNASEYTGTRYTYEEAAAVIENVERFLRFVKSLIHQSMER